MKTNTFNSMAKNLAAASLAALALLAGGTASAAPLSLNGSSDNGQSDAKNLLPNSHFQDPTDALMGWTYTFSNKHYLQNYKYVSVVTNTALGAGTRLNEPARWVRLDGRDKHWTWELGGIQLYTPIIRYNPKKRYRVSVTARSLHAALPNVDAHKGKNPTCRIYCIGYKWHPKAQKTHAPALEDLREEVRFQPFYFDGKSVTGPFSELQTSWKTVTVTVPTPGRTQLQQRHLENVLFLAVKFLVLDGGEFNTGYLDIADVRIEEDGDADIVKIDPGAATKGADGKSWNSSSTGLSQQTGPKSVKSTKKASTRSSSLKK